MRKRILLRRFWAVMLAVSMIISVSACSMNGGTNTEDTRKEESKADSKDISIVAILVSATSTVTSDMGKAMEEHAKEMGIDFTLEYYENDISTYISMIENAIAAGTDAIVTQSTSEEDAIDALKEACAKEGMLVCNFDVEVPGIDYDYCFTADNYALGYAVGELAAEWANENLVANNEEVVCGIGDYSISPVAHARYEGICDALKELCPEANIAMTAEMAYMLDGVEAGENFLQAYPNMNVVCGFNDQSVCGVYETFVAAGLENKKIGMFSCDGIPETLYNISKNTIYQGCIDSNLTGVGVSMLDTLYEDLVKGTKGKKKNYFPTVAITNKNIKDYRSRYESLITE